jgi:hypothetical protein
VAIPGNFLSATTESVDPDTSGWQAVVNCTKSLGSGGRNGDGVLTLTSTAAGEMQALTVAGYVVTANVMYQVFADASSANQAERIGIQWLNKLLTPVGPTTWSLTTSSASATWHRVGVAGVAPVGATRARVVLSATAATGGKTHFWENVYLGAPFVTPGNLLGFGTESAEAGTSSWVPDVNSTVASDAPAVSWPVDWYYSGGEVFKMTVTANGNSSARTSQVQPATAGTQYRGYSYLNPPTSTAVCWVELRYWDASLTLLATKRSTLAQNGTGWYRQYVSGVAPAGTTGVSLAVGITSATAGQALRFEGDVVQEAPAIMPGTVMPYEDGSFEQGVGAWTVSSGTATIARSSPWGTAYEGVYSLTVTSPGAGASVLASGRYPVVPGGSWRAWVQVKPGAGTWQVGPNIHWYDSGGASISRSALAADGITADGTWWTTWNDITAPAGAASAAIEVDVTAPAAGTMQMDAVALFPALPSWDVVADDDLGLITVTMRDLDSGDNLTLYRVAGTGQSLVRGPDGWLQGVLLASTQMVVEDYEAPIGVPVTYRRELYVPSTGALQQSATSGSAQLDVPDPSDVWLKDPIQPQRNIRLMAAVAPDWSRPIEATEYRVRGRRNPVILYDVRGGLAGTLQVWTLSDAERAGLHFLLDTGHPLLIQLSPGLGIDDMYVAVGEATEGRHIPYGGEPRRLWSLPLTQQDAPIGGVGGSAAWTVQDVATTWSTVLDINATYATVFDLLLDNRGV